MYIDRDQLGVVSVDMKNMDSASAAKAMALSGGCRIVLQQNFIVELKTVFRYNPLRITSFFSYHAILGIHRLDLGLSRFHPKLNCLTMA